jgi:hypothetical protein
MSSGIVQLNGLLENMFNENNFTDKDILNIIDPSNSLFNNNSDALIYNINNITSILITDRNGDKQFTVDDLELLSRDPGAIKNIVTSLMLSYSLIDGADIHNKKQDIAYKLILYVLFISIPNTLKNNWSNSDCIKILSICSDIYVTIESSKMIIDILKNIKKITKKSSVFCLSHITKSRDHHNSELKSVDNREIISDMIVVHNAELENIVNNNKEKIFIRKEIGILKNQLGIE